MKKNKRIRVLAVIIILVMLFIIANILIFLFYPYFSEFYYYNSPKYDVLKMQEPVYIMPYIGDIDGEVSEDWFFFYEKLVDFYEEEGIPVTFSFYPASIGDEEFNKIFLKMYEMDNIELMQKGFRGDAREMEIYKLPYEEQRSIIKEGQDVFKQKMAEILRENNREFSFVEVPISYNQISGIVNNDTERALIDLGFKMYFDMFVEGDYAPIDSERDFYVTEYGISFTENGYAGKENRFRTPFEVTREINRFNREDVKVLEINDVKIIPLWVHQQDFESVDKENKLDKEKWNIYTSTMKTLKNDSKVIFLTPRKLYELKSRGSTALF